MMFLSSYCAVHNDFSDIIYSLVSNFNGSPSFPPPNPLIPTQSQFLYFFLKNYLEIK